MRLPLRGLSQSSIRGLAEAVADEPKPASIPVTAFAPESLATGSSAPRAANLSIEQVIGTQIRQQRKRLDITSAELAATARISPGMISKIENGQISSSLATLTAIAGALNVPIASLFAGYDDQSECSLVKAGQGAIIERRGTRSGHIYELLGQSPGADRTIEPFLITLTEKAAPYSGFRHAGVELIYMLTGRVGYRHADKVYDLEPGDTLFFDASSEHGPEELIAVPTTYLSFIVYPKA